MLVKIKVNISGVSIEGDLIEIVKILSRVYKVPSPVIYQFMGEIGIFAAEKEKGCGFTRPYGSNSEVVFVAEVMQKQETKGA